MQRLHSLSLSRSASSLSGPLSLLRFMRDELAEEVPAGNVPHPAATTRAPPQPQGIRRASPRVPFIRCATTFRVCPRAFVVIRGFGDSGPHRGSVRLRAVHSLHTCHYTLGFNSLAYSIRANGHRDERSGSDLLGVLARCGRGSLRLRGHLPVLDTPLYTHSFWCLWWHFIPHSRLRFRPLFM